MHVLQVRDFIRVAGERSAPENWWCKPSAGPGSAKQQVKTDHVKPPTPRPAAGKHSQAQKVPATTGQARADQAAPSDMHASTGELGQALCAAAPLAPRHSTKRKRMATATKHTGRGSGSVSQPAEDQTAAADTASAAPADELVSLAELSAASLASTSAALQPALPGAASAATSAPSVPPQHAVATCSGIPANKMAKTAAKAAQETGGVSVSAARALSQLMQDGQLLEALQELLASLHVHTAASSHPAAMSGQATRAGPEPHVVKAATASQASVPAEASVGQAPTLVSEPADETEASLSAPFLANGNAQLPGEAKAVPDVLVAKAEAPVAALAAMSAPDSAPTLESALPATEQSSVAMVPVSTLAATPIPPVLALAAPSSTKLAAAATMTAPAAQAGSSGQQAGKRLRGKAAALAKALGLSKSRAFKHHPRPEVKLQTDGVNAGKL